MNIRVVAFARIREIIGYGSLDRVVAGDATVAALWTDLVREHPALADLRASTRFACNGAFADAARPLRDGDEVALLPPYGGG